MTETLQRLVGDLAPFREETILTIGNGEPGADAFGLLSREENLALLTLGSMETSRGPLSGLALGPFHPAFVSDGDLVELRAPLARVFGGLCEFVPLNLRPEASFRDLMPMSGLVGSETRNPFQLAVWAAECSSYTPDMALASARTGGRWCGEHFHILDYIEEIHDYGWALPEDQFQDAWTQGDSVARNELSDLVARVLPAREIDERFRRVTSLGRKASGILQGGDPGR